MIRKTVFWLHLGSGVVTGVVIAMMSFTGVLLTYEHQILQWGDRQYFESPTADKPLLSIEQMIEAARSNGIKLNELSFARDERMPALASEGRRGKSAYISQYSGENLGAPGARYRNVFRTITAWHRNFDTKGDARETGHLITGVSNLAFLFLVLTGSYLWLPRVFRWSLFRVRLVFSRNYQTARVRDFHWHHIFGIWSVIPLVVVVGTAVVFSFSWANDLVFKLAGDAPPAPVEILQQASTDKASSDSVALGLTELLRIAKSYDENWKTITLRVPKPGSDTVAFVIDPSSGHQFQRRQTVTLNSSNGTVHSVSGFENMPAGRRTRVFIRFLHTGEVYGLAGQTIAGLVSLASLFLVWTGFAQAWRRLILPPMRKWAARNAG